MPQTEQPVACQVTRGYKILAPCPLPIILSPRFFVKKIVQSTQLWDIVCLSSCAMRLCSAQAAPRVLPSGPAFTYLIIYAPWGNC